MRRVVCTAAAGLALVLAGVTEVARSETVSGDGAQIARHVVSLQTGERTRRGTIEMHLLAVSQREASLNAFIAIDPERLRADASAADRQWGQQLRGPLEGVVVAIKDNLETADYPTTAGAAEVVRTNIAGLDATVVTRLRAAGAVIEGKTNMDTYARGVRTVSAVAGATRNAYDSSRSPGGSSGGSAVAVASGMAMVALGTDTCGSIRYPASYAGLYGLRPTPGLVSRAGLVPLAPTQDVVGPIGHHPADLAAVLDVIAGPDSRDPLTLAAQRGAPLTEQLANVAGASDRRLRVGVVVSLMRSTTPRVREALEQGFEALSAGGVEVVEIGRFAGIANAQVIDDEALPARSDYLKSRRNGDTGDRWLGSPLRARDQRGYRARLANREKARAALVRLMDQYSVDALAYPTTPFLPARVGARQPSANCQYSATTGLPALSVPGGRVGSSRVGFDLLGRPWSEATLLRLGAIRAEA